MASEAEEEEEEEEDPRAVCERRPGGDGGKETLIPERSRSGVGGWGVGGVAVSGGLGLAGEMAAADCVTREDDAAFNLPSSSIA